MWYLSNPFDCSEYNPSIHARKKVQTEQYEHMQDFFTSGAYYPKEEARPVKHLPSDDHGYEPCATGAEYAHRQYFKDRDKPLINRRKQQILSRILKLKLSILFVFEM